MRPSRDYQRQKHSFRPELFFGVGVFLLLGSVTSPGVALAQTDRQVELKTQILTRQQEIQQLEEEVKQHQRDLEQVGGEKKTLQNAVKTIDATRKKLSTDITLTQRKIDTTILSIEELGIEVRDKEIRIDRSKEAVGKIIRLLHEFSQETLVELLFAHQSLSQVFTDADQLTRLKEQLSSQISDLKSLQDALLEKRRNAEAAKQELVDLNGRIQDQKRIADAKRKEQSTLLDETKNKETNYKKILSDKQERIKQFAKELEDYENQLRYELDPQSIPKVGTKALSWPLASIFVTQRFGSSQSAKRLYTSGTHNGIDFRAPVGTPVLSAASGVVVATGDTDAVCRGASYGRWVLIRHNNGLSTLYAHLELIRVGKGEQVVPGQTIGYSGNTGYSTGPHLHFTVFASAAVRVDTLPSSSCKNAVYTIPVSPRNGYLDPEGYL
jgi:murein DD-endopeptidase MepM/ murein hydrolase activator NlpD